MDTQAAESLSASLQRERQRQSDLSLGQRGAQQNARHSRFGGSFLRKSEVSAGAVCPQRDRRTGEG